MMQANKGSDTLTVSRLFEIHHEWIAGIDQD